MSLYLRIDNTCGRYKLQDDKIKDTLLVRGGGEWVVRWLSVNGEAWGVGPTAVFASAAALALYRDMETTVGRDSLLQRTLLSSMVLGMLALMVHLWVCAMRFVQYYLDTIIKDSPSMLLEVTKASLLGDRAELVPLGPLTRFLRQQQPQIHVTLCWFLALCYADYVRKHCCQQFSLPYLEEWQAALKAQAARGVRGALRRVHSFMETVHSRLRTCVPPPPADARRIVDEATRTSCKSCEAATSSCGVDKAAKIASEASRRSCLTDKDLERSTGTEAASSLKREATSKTNLIESLRTYIAQLLEWLRCGDGNVTIIPTVVWTVGAAVLAHRLLTAMFKRFIFRRVPLWEILLQHLMFVWMVIYSVEFWIGLVAVIKYLVELTCKFDGATAGEDVRCRAAEQALVWMSSAVPLMLHVGTRRAGRLPVVMVWVTQNPQYRQELGPFEYYLSRPPPPPARRQRPLRRAHSDAAQLTADTRKRRASKSI